MSPVLHLVHVGLLELETDVYLRKYVERSEEEAKTLPTVDGIFGKVTARQRDHVHYGGVWWSEYLALHSQVLRGQWGVDINKALAAGNRVKALRQGTSFRLILRTTFSQRRSSVNGFQRALVRVIVRERVCGWSRDG